MFICAGCHRSVGPGVRQEKIVTAFRGKEYRPRRQGGEEIDPGGFGWEVAEERAFCPPCAEEVREKGGSPG